MRERVALWLAVVALLVGAWGFYRLTVTASRGGQSTPLYSVRRFDPYGTAALYRLLSERRDGVTTLERPRLPSRLAGTLVQVLALPEEMGPLFEPYELPTAALLAWVGEGNTLIQLTRTGTDVMARTGVTWVDGPAAARIQLHQLAGEPPDAAPGALVEATWTAAALERYGPLDPLVLRAPGTLVSDAPDWHPLATVDGRTVAGEMRHGRGRIILIAAPTPALNAALGEGGNLAFLLAATGQGAVTFDEWSHGIGTTGSVMELLRRFGLLPVLGQLLVVAIAYRWSTRGRRSAPPTEPSRRRSSREQIRVLGHLYRRALDEQDRIRRVYEEVLGRLATALRCRPEQVDARLGVLKSDAAGRARNLLAELRAIGLRYQPRCRSCGYNLTGAVAEHCPECGAWLSRPIRRQIEAQQRSGAKASAAPAGRWREHDLARILNVSHQLMKDLQRG